MFSNIDESQLKLRFNDILHCLGIVASTTTATNVSGKIDMAKEAVMAIGVLPEHSPEAFVQSEMYSDVMKWIIHVMSIMDDDNYLVKAAATNVAGVLISGNTKNSDGIDNDTIGIIANYALTGLDCDEPQLRQATLSFFAKVADVVGGDVVIVFGERILNCVIKAMEKGKRYFILLTFTW